MTNLVFVYGTLKRNYGNYHRCLEPYGAKFLGCAVTATGGYVMQDTGFPILWQEEPALEYLGRARGEIFEVNDEALARCDRLESHPNMYRREKREFVLRTVNGHRSKTVEAWVYLWQLDRDRSEPMTPRSDGTYVWERKSGRLY